MNNLPNNIYKVISIIILFLLIFTNNKNKKKIGVVGVRHDCNIGANLLKYAMSIKLSELGFEPYIIGTHYRNYDISFLKNNTKCIIIKKNFSEIKKNDYDILMVNSDQTWRKFDKNFYDYGFLKFAQNWDIPKFVYGASLGYNIWKLTNYDDMISRNLLKNFTGISIRERGSIKLVKNHFHINPDYVIDPTLLIDKQYYLDLLKNYKDLENYNDNYIFTYLLKEEKIMRQFLKNSSKILGYKIININMKKKNAIINFINGIINCKAVVTNSYHGTIFSIIFNKPFVTFIFKGTPKERFLSLKEGFGIKNRLFEYNQMPNISLLTTPLNINQTFINLLKKKSIMFLKKNLGID